MRKTSGKNLVCRTITPHLSKLVDETYGLLKLANPDMKDFVLLIRCDEKEIKTRILPLTDRAMNELYEVSDDKVSYIAHTDEEYNFTGGEEK